MISETVLLPEPDRPVNHSVKPLCIRSLQNLSQFDVQGALRLPVGRKVNTALLLRIVLPPPAAGTLILPRGDGPRARCAADTRIPLRVQRMLGHVVDPGVFQYPL